MASAIAIRVRGVVQGVGFRPFVYRLARQNTLSGWVLNAGEGVDIFLEGRDGALRSFLNELEREPPRAASITDIDVRDALPEGLVDFEIRQSRASDLPTARVSPDLPVCDSCLAELFDPANRRHLYPYINCTNCGPRYSVVLGLPYDRPNTTMRSWPLDDACAAEYADPADRRFHAEPIACAQCGPHFSLQRHRRVVADGNASVAAAAEALRTGEILAVKGLGGYHLACDARNDHAVRALRHRKFRKDKPFALMVRTLEVARDLAVLSPTSEACLTSAARPIVLTAARAPWPDVAPETGEIGLMLPYTPLHHLLFALGAPDVLVMTSANRSSEPIAYDDDAAVAELEGIADAFLIGGRPIARRVDDSVVRAGADGPMMLRRGRGYAPGVVSVVPSSRPILALGGDLKNAIALVVGGQVMVSQHIGDLEYHPARLAFTQTVDDLMTMYRVDWDDVRVAHDAHPQYVSTLEAHEHRAPDRVAVQHHRAHIASVLAERQAWERQVVGISLDGTGYGDDGTLWGGEFFTGSVASGFVRIGHLRPASLVGGDAAARRPVQAAAGFLTEVNGLPDMMAPPFHFGEVYAAALRVYASGLRTFTTTSMGRLFDVAAALLGFTREITYEGQAAIWLEQCARTVPAQLPYPFPAGRFELDYRPLLAAVAEDRQRGRDIAEISRAFHAGVAAGVTELAKAACEQYGTTTIVCSGGVCQNQLLLDGLAAHLESARLELWTNRLVPPNDGGISLGQAAIAGFQP